MGLLLTKSTRHSPDCLAAVAEGMAEERRVARRHHLRRAVRLPLELREEGKGAD